jgi:hypothetical protein
MIEKIRSLSPENFIELQDFVEFLSQKNMDRKLINAGNKLKVWDNPEDAEYDRLCLGCDSEHQMGPQAV